MLHLLDDDMKAFKRSPWSMKAGQTGDLVAQSKMMTGSDAWSDLIAFYFRVVSGRFNGRCMLLGGSEVQLVNSRVKNDFVRHLLI